MVTFNIFDKIEQILDEYDITFDTYTTSKSIFEKDINHLSKDFKDSNLSLILVLDHIEYPIDFLKRFLNLGISSISLIVEKIDDFKGLPIQHLTGWSKNNLRYIASYLDLKVELLNDEDDNYIFAFFNNT